MGARIHIGGSYPAVALLCSTGLSLAATTSTGQALGPASSGSAAGPRAARPLASDASDPGDVGARATFQHLGVSWALGGDEDRDGRVYLRYRREGEGTWREGLPPVRTHPHLVGEGGDRPDNRWAGSVFWLSPGATYEIELELVDPDGGGTTRVVRATTRSPPAAPDDARRRYVVPGGGGGSGSAADPFRGLQAAARDAAPGDLFEVAPGTYAPFTLLQSGEAGRPIVFRGPGAASAAIDGGGTERGIVTLGAYDQTIEHVMLENLTLENGRWGIDAQHARHILVRHLVVRNVDYGYVNRRGDGLEADQVVCDSRFEGRTQWPASGIPSERAIDLKGDGNVVCYNFISNFGDGVSVQPSTGESWGSDIYGNDLTHIVDDPIEIDYSMANTRVWSNRVTNGRMGISLAPIYGGPVYVFRNTFFNLESSAYKMNREPAGLVIAHNTSLKRGNGTSSPRHWQNTLLRNNFLFGTRYVFEEYGLAPGSQDDWDYDALAREPRCGPSTPPCFKWDNQRYATLADLRVGTRIEAHGIVAQRTDLVRAALPERYETPVAPDQYELLLRSQAPEIDAGENLPNLNEPWVSDGHPDIGAFEYGAARPHYGPRAYGAPLVYVTETGAAPSPAVPSPAATTAEPRVTATEPPPTVTPTAGQPIPADRERLYLPLLSRD